MVYATSAVADTASLLAPEVLTCTDADTSSGSRFINCAKLLDTAVSSDVHCAESGNLTAVSAASFGAVIFNMRLPDVKPV